MKTFGWGMDDTKKCSTVLVSAVFAVYGEDESYLHMWLPAFTDAFINVLQKRCNRLKRIVVFGCGKRFP